MDDVVDGAGADARWAGTRLDVAAAEQFELRLVTLDARSAGAPDVRCEVLVGPISPG